MPVCRHRARATRAVSTHTLHDGLQHARHRPRRQKWPPHAYLPRRRRATHSHATVVAGVERRRTCHVAQIRHAIDENSIEDEIAKAEALLIHDGSRVSCDTRCIPVGGGNNHVEELAWIRAPYRATSHTPEALRGIGTPCLLSHDLAAQRKDAHHWPVPGFGHYFSAQRGDMVACVIPCEPLMDRGSSMKDAVTFLCNWA